MFRHYLIRLGPMLLSAFFLFLSSLLIQTTVQIYDPTFSLLANRGLGKIIFTLLAIASLGIIILLQTKHFRNQWLKTNCYFLCNKHWMIPFLKSFSIFFILHSTTLFLFFLMGFASYQHNWLFTHSTFLSIGFGFIVTFFLAWTEELIFRGTIYPFFAQFWSPLSSILATSFIFMLAHNITQPLCLITTDWKLGLGLFLLGVILNLFFVISRTLYVGMGIHAGLVFVKVILRRMKVIEFLPSEQLPFWVDVDLRQSLIIHILFLMVIFIVIMRYKNQFSPNNKNV